MIYRTAYYVVAVEPLAKTIFELIEIFAVSLIENFKKPVFIWYKLYKKARNCSTRKILCFSINSEEKYFCAQTYTCYLVPVNACHLLLATV